MTPVIPSAKQPALEDHKVNVKIKLASLWCSFMFLYIYVDYFALYMPNKINDILIKKVYVFDITSGFLLAALISVSIPALMIFLSILLSARINRWTNMIVGTLYIPYSVFNLAGEAWIHMIYGAVLEVLILVFIIRMSWKWPILSK